MLGGRRILGDPKTWRGLLAGIVVGALVFEAQRLAWQAGFARELLVWTPPLVTTLLCVPVILGGHVAVTTLGYWLGLKEAWI